MSNTEGYFYLAMAIIRQTVADLEGGGPGRSKDARLAILSGGLDRWVDIVCVTHHARDAIRAKLVELATQDP